MYYVAVMDCGNKLHYLLGEETRGKIFVSTSMTDDGSEIPYEMQGIIQMDIFLLLILISLYAQNWRDWTTFIKRHQMEDTPHIFCICAMGFQMAAIVFDLWYNSVLAIYGDENMWVYAFSLILSMVGETIMIVCLMMMAYGWMSSWTEYDPDDGIEWYATGSCIFVLMIIAFTIVTIWDKDAHHKYHDFSGIMGDFLILFKFIFVAIFVYIWYMAKNEIDRKAKKFYN